MYGGYRVGYYALDTQTFRIGAPIASTKYLSLQDKLISDINRIYGGTSLQIGGIETIQIAWDFLADYYVYTFSRAYISTKNNLRVRVALGTYGKQQDTIEIDGDMIYEGKAKINYSPLSVVVGSCVESVGKDVGKYEESRAGSRNAGEYTVPVVFGNVPAAIEYKKKSKTTWVGFTPHIFGVYYKQGDQFYGCHHYVDIPISYGKRSNIYTECQYSISEMSAAQLMEMFRRRSYCGNE
jgi:hypothetical protein